MELTINEIIFLDYISKNGTVNNINHWKYEFGIDTEFTIKKLLNNNYIKELLDLKSNLSKLKIPELKDILKDNNLKTQGNKENLINRIIENIDNAILEQTYSNKTLIATEKGLKIIHDNYVYIINKNMNYGFSEFEIKEAYNTFPKYLKPNDIVWHLLDNRKNKELVSKNWGLYRNNLYNMGYILFHEDKYLDALKFYIAVFIIDLSGMENNNTLMEISYLTLAPQLLKNLKNLVSLANPSQDTLFSLFKNNKLVYLPFEYYTRETCYTIFKDCCLAEKDFLYNNYNFNIPTTNSQLYTYYNISLDTDTIVENFDININNTTKTSNSYNKIKKKESIIMLYFLFATLILLIAMILLLSLVYPVLLIIDVCLIVAEININRRIKHHKSKLQTS